MQRKHIPNVLQESYKMHQHIGYNLNLIEMPNYFVDLCNQAGKQLNHDDVKSIIKARSISENKLEKAYDIHKSEMLYDMRRQRTQNLLRCFYD